MEEKWAGAPFAALLRRDQLNYSEAKGNILLIAFTLVPTNSNVKQVNYASIILQVQLCSSSTYTLLNLCCLTNVLCVCCSLSDVIRYQHSTLKDCDVTYTEFIRYCHLLMLFCHSQPLDLNIDEETLMKLVPFWRTSLSDSTAPSRQFYFKHFEIHPVKV